MTKVVSYVFNTKSIVNSYTVIPSNRIHRSGSLADLLPAQAQFPWYLNKIDIHLKISTLFIPRILSTISWFGSALRMLVLLFWFIDNIERHLGKLESSPWTYIARVQRYAKWKWLVDINSSTPACLPYVTNWCFFTIKQEKRHHIELSFLGILSVCSDITG